MKLKNFKNVSGILLTSAVTFASLSSMSFTTPATETITVAPETENILNVQVTDKEGNPVYGIHASLLDTSDYTVASWTTSEKPVSRSFSSGISIFADDSVFFASNILKSLVAPYTLEKIFDVNENYEYLNSIAFKDGQKRTLQLLYFGDAETALTVPGNTLVTFVDSSWASRYHQAGIQIGDTKYNYNSNAGKITEYPLAAGSYKGINIYLSSGSSGIGNENIEVKSEATEYIKVRSKLSDIDSRFNEDGTVDEPGHFNFVTDDKDNCSVLTFVSGSVVNAVVPDSQGYVEFYVEKSSRRYVILTNHKWHDTETGTYGSGGGIAKRNFAYDRKTYDCQAIQFPKTGTNLLNVPAGNYTINLSNVPEQYDSVQTNITVTDSQNIQQINIVLEHVHDYGNEYQSDENQHWKECRCGDKTDAQSHDFIQITDKEPTETKAGYKHEECTVCGYKKANVEIPALEPTAREDETTAKEQETTTTRQEPSTENQEEATIKQDTSTKKQDTSVPITGDTTSSTAFILILFTSMTVFTGIFAVNNKKKHLKDR